MASHVLYIDDSGTKEYSTDPARYVRHGPGNSRYFVFGSVLTTTVTAGELTTDIRALKRQHFGTDEVEIKSNWLRMPSERKRRYLQAYGLDDAQLTAFVDAYYDAICAAPIQFVAAVIDKPHVQERYGMSPWYAPAIAYDLILQRVEAELAGRGTTTVTIDNMTGATPKQNQYRDNLDRQHEKLKKYGSQLLKSEKFTTVEGRLKFVNSAHYDLVQVADIVAYNVYRQFVQHGESWEDAMAKTLPTYEYFDRICKKFRCDPNGRIQGYGVVKFPLLQQVRWVVRDDPAKQKAVP